MCAGSAQGTGAQQGPCLHRVYSFVGGKMDNTQDKFVKCKVC